MPRLISATRALQILNRYADWIDTVSARYGVPSALIKAILFQEATRINTADVLADIVVNLGITSKKDSSTGYAQIFGYVGLIAINFAADNGLATYEGLGIAVDHRLNADSIDDVRLVWKKLRSDAKANIEIATLNMLVAAYETVGRFDYSSFTDDEFKLAATRYNANTNRITLYGEQVFDNYCAFKEGRAPTF